MALQKGSLVLLKAGDGGDPETFSTIGGLQGVSLQIKNTPVVTTSVSSGEWQQLMPTGGIGRVVISGKGLFTDAASEKLMRADAFGKIVRNYQITFGNGDVLEGGFLITDYIRKGTQDSEEVYEITVENASEVAYQEA
jgi:predicted secreted protein